MGIIKTTLLLAFTIGSSYITYVVYDAVFSDHPAPIVLDEFWGPGSKPDQVLQEKDEKIYPFKVDFTSAQILNPLKAKLQDEIKADRLLTPVEGVGFGYGFNSKFLKTVLNHWLTKYDFAAREKWLNRYPHFKTKIGGLDIHFQHIKPTNTKKKYSRTLPLILIHGWPGSFVEYQKTIEYFLEPEGSEVNFELIIPSLPGFGFSQAASREGLGPWKIANIFGRLMKRLGHKKYYAMGEDYGLIIAGDMGILYPDNVIAAHTSCASLHPRDALVQTIVGAFSPSSVFGTPRIKERFNPASKLFIYTIIESGYLHIQATKPDTIGAGLNNSPSGLAAYILEKFSTWTNASNTALEDGGLTKAKFSLDEALDNVMVYWVSKSATSSVRLYREFFGRGWHTMRVPVPVPYACTMLVEDVILASEVGLKAKYPHLKQFEIVEGGHFGAFEVPKEIVKHAVKFFGGVELGKIK